jgi:hypothetical protein
MDMGMDMENKSQTPCRLLPVLLDLSDKHVCVIGDAPEAGDTHGFWQPVRDI